MSANYEYYRVFFEVAKHGNITRAASALCLTQPTITKAVQNLEEQLGCRLFVRSKKGVALTPEGDSLFSRVGPACELIATGEKELEMMKSLKSGIIRIASNDVAVRNYLMPHLEEYRAKYPDVQIIIERIPISSADAILNSGHADLAILGMPVEQTDGIDLRILENYYDTPVAGSKYSFLAEREITLKELLEYPLIFMSPGTYTRGYYDLLFEEHGLALNPGIELAEIDLVILMTEHNFGVSFIPESYAEEKIENGSLYKLKVKDATFRRQICGVTSKTRPLSIAAKEFYNMLWPK